MGTFQQYYQGLLDKFKSHASSKKRQAENDQVYWTGNEDHQVKQIDQFLAFKYSEVEVTDALVVSLPLFRFKFVQY